MNSNYKKGYATRILHEKCLVNELVPIGVLVLVKPFTNAYALHGQLKIYNQGTFIVNLAPPYENKLH